MTSFFTGMPHILRFGGHGGQREPQGIGTVGVDDIHRIDAVALGLAHPLALAVEDGGVDGHVWNGSQDRGRPTGEGVPVHGVAQVTPADTVACTQSCPFVRGLLLPPRPGTPGRGLGWGRSDRDAWTADCGDWPLTPCASPRSTGRGEQCGSPHVIHPHHHHSTPPTAR